MSHEVRLPNGKLLIFWFECQVCNKVSQTLDEFIDHKKCYHKLNEIRNTTHFVLSEKPPLELESVNQFRVPAPTASATDTELSPILKSTLNNNRRHVNTAANDTGDGAGAGGLTKRLKPQPFQKFIVQPSHKIASNSDVDVVLPPKIQQNGDQEILLATTSREHSPGLMRLLANNKYKLKPQLATSNTKSFRNKHPYTVFKSADLNSKTVVKGPVKNVKECTTFSQAKQESQIKSISPVMPTSPSNSSSVSNNALKNPIIMTDNHNLRACDSRGFTQVNETNFNLPSKILASASESSGSDTDLDSQDSIQEDSAESCTTVLKRIQNYERQVRQINENNFSLKNWLLDERSKMIVSGGIAGKNVILLEPDPIENDVGLITVKNPIKCKLCGLKLVSEPHLKHHVLHCWAENKEDHIYCTICDMSLNNTFDLRRHQYELHNNNVTRRGRDFLLLTNGSRKEGI